MTGSDTKATIKATMKNVESDVVKSFKESYCNKSTKD